MADSLTPDGSGDLSLTLVEEEADSSIRRQLHDGRMFFSVVDVIAVLTESPSPRQYWGVLKKRLTDDGARELLTRRHHLKLTAADGKLRETDCADFATIMSLVHLLPALHRRADCETLDQRATAAPCGIYAIVNTITQERYIGSSGDIMGRFAQHKWSLRRGKHHAQRLQEAWNTYGEDAFVFVVLEDLVALEQLTAIEQRYLDAERPAYNSAAVANNPLDLEPIPEERLRNLLLWLYDSHSSTTQAPLFGVLRDAILYGVVTPGPNFQLLLEAETSGIDTWSRFGAYLQQRQCEQARQEV